jgi:transcriptional regulator with XRE-family HTH domain
LVRFRLKCLKPKAYAQDPKTIGDHIKKRRIELGLSQPQAAERLAVSAATVLNWETGLRHPQIRSIPAILSFLGYDPFPAPTTIGERLAQARRQHGWTTDEAAYQLGVDRTAWQAWEHGQIILFRKHRAQVARFLGVDPRELADAMRARWNGKHRRWERPRVVASSPS